MILSFLAAILFIVPGFFLTSIYFKKQALSIQLVLASSASIMIYVITASIAAVFNVATSLFIVILILPWLAWQRLWRLRTV